jgi:hypothetical protein
MTGWSATSTRYRNFGIIGLLLIDLPLFGVPGIIV